MSATCPTLAATGECKAATDPRGWRRFGRPLGRFVRVSGRSANWPRTNRPQGMNGSAVSHVHNVRHLADRQPRSAPRRNAQPLGGHMGQRANRVGASCLSNRSDRASGPRTYGSEQTLARELYASLLRMSTCLAEPHFMFTSSGACRLIVSSRALRATVKIPRMVVSANSVAWTA